MKNVKTFAYSRRCSSLHDLIFGSFAAQSISAHGSTLDRAEAYIAAKA